MSFRIAQTAPHHPRQSAFLRARARLRGARSGATALLASVVMMGALIGTTVPALAQYAPGPGLVQDAQGRWVPAGSAQAQRGSSSPDLRLSELPTTDWSRISPQPRTALRPPPVADALGAGDEVRVSVFGQPDLETTTTVSEAGIITLPLIGGVSVAGVSPQQAERRIAAAYQGGGFLLSPQITLSVQALRSRQISVLGQVANPGRFAMTSSMTLLDAIALAGGISRDGGSEVFLLRKLGNGETQKYAMDLDALVGAPGTTGLVELAAGDTLYVPEAPKFFIYGAVRQPDSYPLKAGMTVLQAISVGGGLTDRGSDSRIRIRREDANGRVRTIRADVNDEVRENDVIEIKERFF